MISFFRNITGRGNGEIKEIGKRVDNSDVSLEVAKQSIREAREEEIKTLWPDVTPYRPPSFEPNDPALRHYLHEYGYVVVREVIDKESSDVAIKLLWDFLELTSGMRRDDISTWDEFPGDRTTGLLYAGGIGHSDFLWHTRAQPRVHEAFSTVWETEDLITSFDGGNVFRPYEPVEGDGPQPDADWRTYGGWYHVDQGSSKKGLQAVQGIVTITPAGSDRGGLVVVPGSHLHHEELMKRSYGTRDFVRIAPGDPLMSPPFAPVVIECDAGDMILWDSRTIHCNTPAIASPAKVDRGELLRVAAYICMTPRRKASEDTLKARIGAYESNTTSTHWPHELHLTISGKKLPKRTFEEAPEAIRQII